MVLSTHVIVRGDQQHRLFLEDVGVLTADGVDAFFTWDLNPITGRGATLPAVSASTSAGAAL
jgi:hypothetical protein